MNLKCPVCQKELYPEKGCYRCLQQHAFDISKEGYVNLLRKQSQKEFGDSVEMVRARHAFFAKDYYQPLKETIARMVQNQHPDIMVDCGCGEGYYTNYLKKQMPDMTLLGIDISKEAIRLAAKHSQVLYAVASTQHLPCFDASVDLVMNCFAPLDLTEIYRVLRSKGILLSVSVGRDHLLSLKKQIYDTVYLNDELEIESDLFQKIGEEKVAFELPLKSNEDILELYQMTPYSQKSEKAGYTKLSQIDTMLVECRFVLKLYQKIPTKL